MNSLSAKMQTYMEIKTFIEDCIRFILESGKLKKTKSGIVSYLEISSTDPETLNYFSFIHQIKL